MASQPVKRDEFKREGKPSLYRYPGRVIRNGKPASDTIYVDWFENDQAAETGLRQIMEDQGYTVLSVVIGETSDVTIA